MITGILGNSACISFFTCAYGWINAPLGILDAQKLPKNGQDLIQKPVPL